MQRNRNVDYLRVFAIWMIVVYHCYVLTGSPWSEHQKIHTLISFGGEIGVTLFFALSGFGIFWSLYRKENRNQRINWRSFMKQRCRRIMPQYYACICVLLIFQSTGLVGKSGVKAIVTYLTFTQNLFIDTHGAINGALWSMATIFQFYLVAPWLYRMVKRNWFASGMLSVAFTIISKIVIYHIILPQCHMEGVAYFIYGRQLVSALDNFVLGMVAAKVAILLAEQKKNNSIMGIIGTIVVVCMLAGIPYISSTKVVYGDTVYSYIVHSVLAILLSLLIVFVSIWPILSNDFDIPGKIIDFYAKYQYGIYLWHMPLIICLYNGSPLFQFLIAKGFIFFFVAIGVAVTIVGYYSTKWIAADK